SAGDDLAAKGDYGRAIVLYSRAVEIDPTDAYLVYVYSSRATAYANKGDIDRAIDDYSRAIEIKPEDADFRKERGKLYRAKGERDRASADFTKAIEIYSSVIASSPSDFAAYWQRADVHALSGDEVAMIADYDKIVVLLSDPKTAVDFNRRAWAHFKANRAEKGLPDAVRSLEIAPDNADALDTRGHIL